MFCIKKKKTGYDSSCREQRTTRGWKQLKGKGHFWILVEQFSPGNSVPGNRPEGVGNTIDSRLQSWEHSDSLEILGLWKAFRSETAWSNQWESEMPPHLERNNVLQGMVSKLLISFDFLLQFLFNCMCFGPAVIGVSCYGVPACIKRAPSDSFLSDPLKRNFCLSGVPLNLCKFILAYTIIFLSFRSF